MRAARRKPRRGTERATPPKSSSIHLHQRESVGLEVHVLELRLLEIERDPRFAREQLEAENDAPRDVVGDGRYAEDVDALQRTSDVVDRLVESRGHVDDGSSDRSAELG